MFHFDHKLITGLFLGLLLGLHYHGSLITYMPIVMVITVIMLLQLIRR